MSWDIGFPTHPSLSGEHLYVGEWRCPGEKRGWEREPARYFEIQIQQTGGHLREFAAGSKKERRFVDATVVTVNPAGHEYRTSFPSDHPQRSTMLLLRGDLLDEITPIPYGTIAPLSTSAALLHQRMLRAESELAIEEAALGLATQVVADFARERPLPPPKPPSASWRRLAEEIQHVLATRSGDRLSLSEIARACGVSHFHASRVFRAVTGSTIHEQLTRVRLRLALLELGHADGELTALALNAGFSSHSHFTSAFRAEFGVPPSCISGHESARRR